METLRHLVQTAAGFDADRGDTVTIESLQFTLPPEQGALVEAGGGGFFAAQGARLVQVGVLGAIVLALILFVLRPLLGRRPSDAALADLTGMRAIGPDAARPIPAGFPATGDILDLSPQTISKIDRLREVITSRGDESSAVLRSWIEAPDTRKESAG
jgi:flagellar M-ring protein FliF